MKEGGIYIHIPYCRKKCLYCDFYSAGNRIADWDGYVDALINEFSSRREELNFNLQSLYLGGGTPSLMPANHLIRLIDSINKQAVKETWKEFTIEINPEDVNEENLLIWKDLGINRVSLGIQSLNDTELKKIGRTHTSKISLNAFYNLKKYFENISVDVMFGLPLQTEKTYTDTLKKIIELKPQHISSYSLMLEKGTALTYLAEKDLIILPSEEEYERMYKNTCEFLKDAGYLRYEISNYSLEGKESYHNNLYWRGNPYIGLGPGAHSYDGNTIRRWNNNDLKNYIKYYKGKDILSKNDSISIFEIENLNKEELKEEMIMTRLRLSQGLNMDEFEKRFGKEQKEILLHKSSKFVSDGFMKEDNNYLQFTDKGFFISDNILSSLI